MYAFDACTAEEKLVVEQMLAQYPEVKQELEAIQQSFETMAEQLQKVLDASPADEPR